MAGDALQTYAYEVLAKLQCPAEARVAIIAEIAHDTGTIDGMIGGQVMDLEAEHRHPDAQTLEYIHRSKTGALLTASVVTGGMYAGADASQLQSLRDFGQNIGLAFQIVDDVLDVTQTSEQLGKTAGKDTAARQGNVSRAVRHRRLSQEGRRASRRRRCCARSSSAIAPPLCATLRSFWWRGRSSTRSSVMHPRLPTLSPAEW